MANSYFKFKQFTIQQDKCAMKVCTDACLFGALVASQKWQSINCLDIGTGTGLLTLMIAQKHKDLIIDAVEIDAEAAEQAKENIGNSPWGERVQVIQSDVLKLNGEKNYDFIISNPPFYEKDLQSPDETVNKARHNSTLNLAQLLKFVDTNLSTNGKFAVLLPYQRVDEFIEEAASIGFFLLEKILVRQTYKHKFFRGILFFQRAETEIESSEFIIKDPEHNYTPEFTALLKDYYLFL